MGIFDRFRRSATSAATTSVTSPDSATATAEHKGIFARLKQGLQKTTRLLQTDVRDLFKSQGQLLDEDFLNRLFALLVRTDMGVGPAQEVRTEVQEHFRGRVVEMEELLGFVREKLLAIMTGDETEEPLRRAASGPTVMLVVGVNGSGKTTSIAKLAQLMRNEGHSVVLGAGDTFRAAAVQQLTVWAERVGAEIVTAPTGSDPASVAHRAVARAIEKPCDICIIDTAGRLQTQTNLMEELSKVRRVIAKLIPDAPHEVLLVLDATAGQNGISQAKGFSDAVQCTGIVLSKLDGTAKGGVVIPIRRQFELPVKFVGVGEGADDLVRFEPQAFVDALFAETTVGL